jgi:hydroxymethylbilane synthase
MRALVIGSRSSRLALWQANWVRDRIEAGGHSARIEIIHTSGDRQLDRPLVAIGGKGVFVKEIEEALLAGSIDLAVHSLKDLPTAQPEGLTVACIPEREDPRDVLISSGSGGLDRLARGAVVGTGSPRRACQIHALRPDLVIRDLRGNVDTRLAKLARGDYEAIVLALAGIRRLEVEVEGTALDYEQMLPAVGQGALAIETRSDDSRFPEILAPLHHETTEKAVLAERAFLKRLGGGCQAPVGAIGVVDGDLLVLRGLVGDPEARRVLRDRAEGPSGEPDRVGCTLAERLLERGAAAMLNRAPAAPRMDAP